MAKTTLHVSANDEGARADRVIAALVDDLSRTAINGGRHVAPCFAGDTVYAWSEILEKEEIPGRSDVAVLRVRTVATKDMSCENFPNKADENSYEEGVILDLGARHGVATPLNRRITDLIRRSETQGVGPPRMQVAEITG